VKYKTSHL